MTAKMQLDLSYAQAKPVVLRALPVLHLVLVGCGGTGSWLLPHLVRLAVLLQEARRPVRISVIDPDLVEPKNLIRQNFADAEVGRNKAITLAYRFSGAWGIPIRAIPEPLQATHIPADSQILTIICGGVDNAAARLVIATLVESRNEGKGKDQEPTLWWLDSGNALDSGQVALGCLTDPASCRHAVTAAGLCRALPAPSLQYPDLLVPRLEENAPQTLSCADLLLRNGQSLMINQAMATAAGAMLYQLLIRCDLRYMSHEIDLVAGVARSRYTTKENVRRFAQQK